MVATLVRCRILHVGYFKRPKMVTIWNLRIRYTLKHISAAITHIMISETNERDAIDKRRKYMIVCKVQVFGQ